MPRIPDLFLKCIVYLYDSPEDARNAVKAGGTGFLVGVPIEGMPLLPPLIYIVTNSHVAINARAARINTYDGASDVIPVSTDGWVHHSVGDDLAVAAIGISPERFRYKYLAVEMLLTRGATY